MTWNIVVDSNTLSIVDWYFGDLPVNVTPGITLPVAPPLTWDTDMATRNPDTSEITLVSDPTKVQAKTAQAWTNLRAERNALLQASDYTQLTDAHTSLEKKQAWADYRQALRDLPDEVTDPTQVDWPVLVLDPPVTGSRVGNLLGQV